jgi:polyisoprenyl-phosphate glycosyltransferase
MLSNVEQVKPKKEADLGLAIVMPSHNDFESASLLSKELFDKFALRNIDLRIFIVDDGSAFDESNYFEGSNKLVDKTKILYLNIKSGHQSAILKGLIWVSENFPNHHVLIMDADGEDTAQGAAHLLDALLNSDECKVILAERGKRNANRGFILGYVIFSRLFRILVGKNFNTGNFMIIRNSWVKRAINLPTATLHISMAIQRYCPQAKKIVLDRGNRLAGKSKMNYTTLTMHAYGALAVYADIFLSRLILILFPLIFTFFAIPISLTVLRAFDIVDFQKGWVSLIASFSIGIGVVLLTQVVLSVLIMLRISANNLSQEKLYDARD